MTASDDTTCVYDAVLKGAREGGGYTLGFLFYRSAIYK